MALFKCKMCGGSLEIRSETVATCEYCGTQQTVPKLEDERKVNLYDRANHFRRNNDFDKAADIYEQILNADTTDAEAYWSLVLCRYGIEYVEDPATRRRIPTVNRAQFTSVFDDGNYQSALKYAQRDQRGIYEAEAKAINEIQKGILAISQREAPFDVFICYKETDHNGRRTPDSVLANELYHQLTQEGFKVFFSRITLEDKLGSAYEPYIFAALNSAKVMVVIGTKPEYFNAVWVKNEWSRYLSLVKSSGGEKILIPAYRDMDPYNLPDEFAHLQAQDMSRLGFMQDLIRGIKKLTHADTPKATVVKEPIPAATATATAPLLKRAFMFLEDGDWNAANEYCEKVLDADPECAQAYLGKLMAQLRVKKPEALKDCPKPFDGENNYQKTLRFADDKLKSELTGYIEHINKRNETARLDAIYQQATKASANANCEYDFLAVAKLFDSISGHRDAGSLAKKCRINAENAKKDAVYSAAMAKLKGETLVKTSVYTLELALQEFQSIKGWKDADDQIPVCRKRIEALYAKEEADRLEQERKAEADRLEQEQREKRNKKIKIIATSVACAVIAFIIFVNAVIIPAIKYNAAVALMEAGDKSGAAVAFGNLEDYKDAKEQSAALWEEISVRDTISAGGYHTAGLKADGTVVAVGDNDKRQCNTNNWTDIVAISAGSYHTVGLKTDGTAVAVGENNYRRCNVSDWTDIVAISAGSLHTVGLKSDGTVVAEGDKANGRCNVSNWTDIVAISAGGYHTVGLKSDGTVVAVGDRVNGRCNVSDWTDIIAISAGSFHTVGLKADGTVVAVGYNEDGQCNVSDWTDIIAISTGSFHTVGLKSDGTVVAVGYNDYSQCDVSGWTDIVAVSAGNHHTVGLKEDGTVVAVGHNDYGQCNVSDWTNIKLPD